MIHAYDKALKLHIAQFLQIGDRKVYLAGLQNEEDSDDLLMNQIGSKDDVTEFPVLSLIRLPRVEITDDAQTKRTQTYNGYYLIDQPDQKVTLNVMRCNLYYALDVWAENRRTVEDIGVQVFFRLRNNPNFKVINLLPVKNERGEQETGVCVPNIVLDAQMLHLKPQGDTLAQLYRYRMTFTLQNVNLYDYSMKQMLEFNYFVQAKLATDEDFHKV